MNRIITIMLVLFSLITNAAPPRDVFTTQGTGDWSNALNWDLGVPPNDQTGNNDDIHVEHNITLNGNLNMKSGSALTVTSNTTLTVNGDVTFNNGSSILIETNGVLLVNGDVTNSNNSDDVVINGKIIINGNYSGGNGSELGGGGSMDVSGSVSTDGSGSVFGSTSDCDTDCDNSAATPLPVDLLWFNCRMEGDVVVIEWATGSEKNNDYFELSRLIDGDWVKISTIEGAGNSNTIIMYSYEDYESKYGYNYYQLSQVDYDGGKEYFTVISIFKPNKNSIKGMNIFPNPSKLTQKVNVELIGFNGEEILIVVMNTLGEIFYEKAVITHDGSNIIVIDSNLPSGSYLVVGSEKQDLYRRKLIVK